MSAVNDAVSTGKIWDVIVIGGGPAGAVAALSLAKRGRRVIVVEKARFPRFHVGESFLPAAFDQLKKLGLEPALRAIPHVPKFGAHFSMGYGGKLLEIDFLDGYCDGKETFNVERSVFDEMLLREAQRGGAQVHEGIAVREILKLTDGDVRVATDIGEIRGRYLFDASGQGAVVARHLGTRKPVDDPHLKKVAYGGHFQNVWRPSGRQAGHPLIVMMEEGWFWVIPLNETKTSVGMVLDAEIARNIGRDENIPPDRMLAWGISRCPAMRRRMDGATGGPTNIVVADFSYTCRPYAGDGYFLVGDSASFQDPIFSTGISIAFEAAASAARQVDNILAGRVTPDRARRLHIDLIESSTRTLFKLIGQYYDHSFRELFLQGEGPFAVHKALIGVLAGNVFPRPPWEIRWRLWLFDRMIAWNRKRQMVTRRRRFSILSSTAEPAPAIAGE
ncbi:MAG TPA: FAD-dependent oxidoreductase [Tepidisphaeraceae bacterium]|nr:FAD-dependent oxidoreductase [Tepidisphaeraceae bacterium]